MSPPRSSPGKLTVPGLPGPLLRSSARIADAPLARIAELHREAVLSFAGGNALVIFTEECTGRPQKKAGDEKIIAKVSIGELQQLRASLTGGRGLVGRSTHCRREPAGPGAHGCGKQCTAGIAYADRPGSLVNETLSTAEVVIGEASGRSARVEVSLARRVHSWEGAQGAVRLGAGPTNLLLAAFLDVGWFRRENRAEAIWATVTSLGPGPVAVPALR